MHCWLLLGCWHWCMSRASLFTCLGRNELAVMGSVTIQWGRIVMDAGQVVAACPLQQNVLRCCSLRAWLKICGPHQAFPGEIR